MDLSHATASRLLENQLSSPLEIGKAHQFFQPAQIQLGNATISTAAAGQAAVGHAAIGASASNAAIGNAAIAKLAAVPGADGTTLAVKAMAVVSQQVSPIIQLIMRMPGHIGLLNSAFEALSNFLLPQLHNLIGGLDPSLLTAHAEAGASLSSAMSAAGEHMHLDFSLLPHDASFLQELNLHGDVLGLGGEHGFDLSYVNEHLFDQHSLDVSGTLDVAKPQFENVSFTDQHGELISGPSLSHSSPATHLADDKNIFLEKGFGLNQLQKTMGSNLLASSAGTVPAAAPSASQALLASATPGSLPSSLNVSSSAFAAPASGNAMASLGTPDSGAMNALSSSPALNNPSADASSFGPSGAVDKQLLALNDTAANNTLKSLDSTANSSITPDKEYASNFSNTHHSGGHELQGLKAKELSLNSVGSKNLSTVTDAKPGNALEQLHKQSHDLTKHTGPKHHHLAKQLPSIKGQAGGTSQPSTAPAKFGAPGHGANAGQAAKADSGADTDKTAANDAIKTADSTDATTTTDYKIQSGDCLWNIAKDKLGDATKWTEIYKANSDVLGSNPDLIHPGTTIHVPGQSIAQNAAGEVTKEATKYVVKPGDNLWNISKSHLHDATKWGEIYKLNHDVIGANPRLITPGQELTLPGTDGSATTVADASAVTPDVHAATDQVAQAMPEAHAPTEFGHPSGAEAPSTAGGETASPPVAEQAPHVSQPIPPQSLDTSLPASGGATAAPLNPGPGAAGAATLNSPAATHLAQAAAAPLTQAPQVSSQALSAPPPPAANGAPSSPENSSVVNSSLGSDLANFLTKKFSK
jgi:nucleoid-associated protein YgaU